MSRAPKSRMCLVCAERWAPSALGLCRKCARATGADLRNTQERDRDRFIVRQQERPALPALGISKPAVLYELQIDGHHYEVRWNGARPFDSLEWVHPTPR